MRVNATESRKSKLWSRQPMTIRQNLMPLEGCGGLRSYPLQQWRSGELSFKYHKSVYYNAMIVSRQIRQLYLHMRMNICHCHIITFPYVNPREHDLSRDYRSYIGLRRASRNNCLAQHLKNLNSSIVTMAAALSAFNAKLRSHPVLNYVCSTRMCSVSFYEYTPLQAL